MKIIFLLVIGLVPFSIYANQCFVDYYNPEALKYMKKSCEAKVTRTIASTKKIKVNLMGAVKEELSKNLMAADINFDGKADFFRKWKNGKLVSISYDSNSDGKIDFQLVYDSKERIRQEKMDRNLDGKWDYIKTFTKRGEFKVYVDTDYNKKFDEVHHYSYKKGKLRKSVKKLQKRSIASVKDYHTYKDYTPSGFYEPNSKRQRHYKKHREFLPDPNIVPREKYIKSKDGTTEADTCLECYAKEVENFALSQHKNILGGLYQDDFKYEEDESGDFFKSNGMLIHKSCLEMPLVKQEVEEIEERPYALDIWFNMYIEEIIECFNRMIRNNKGTVNALNTGHYPNLLRRLGVKNDNGKPIFGKYDNFSEQLPLDYMKKEKEECLRRQKNSENVKCYFSDEIKITCGDWNKIHGTAIASFRPNLATTDMNGRQLQWNDHEVYVTHPHIHFSFFNPDTSGEAFFQEISRSMGQMDQMNLMNPYTHACIAACFQRDRIESFGERENLLPLAEKLCLSHPLANEDCQFFRDLSKVLKEAENWGEAFHVNHLSHNDSDWRAEARHIKKLCEGTPGAFDEIYKDEFHFRSTVEEGSKFIESRWQEFLRQIEINE